MRFTRAGIAVLAIIAALMIMPGLSVAVDNVEVEYAGSASGDWSGGGANVVGVEDGNCANMGAVGKENFAYGFGFDLTDCTEVTGVSAEIFAGASDGQNVNVQLITDPTVPTEIGSAHVLAVTAVGTGACKDSTPVSTGGDLSFWGTDSGTVTCSVARTANFGLQFEKTETSQVKVDAICMEISYVTPSGPALEEDCFETLTYCGDGNIDEPNTSGFTEECDDAGESATCDDDCTAVACGDGNTNETAGEICDTAGESASCDDDCTAVECGDENLNQAAGEQCDDGNTEGGDGCSASCQIENPDVIPTMNEWGMIIFIVLAGLISLYFLRRQKNH